MIYNLIAIDLIPQILLDFLIAKPIGSYLT